MSQIVLLTGSVIEMRKLKTKDVDAILASKPRAFVTNLLGVLKSCTVSVIDAGIYAPNFDWLQVYEGDWFDALFQLRALTFGEDYSFQIRCNNPRCSETQDVDYDLNTLERKPPSIEILDALKNKKNRFLRDFSMGKVEVIIPTASEMIAIANSRRNTSVVAHKSNSDELAGGDKVISDILQTKILKVIVDDNTFEGQRKNAFLDDLDMDVTSELTEILEDNGFGIQMDLEIKCSDCQSVIEFSLPLAKTFFLPKRKKSV